MIAKQLEERKLCGVVGSGGNNSNGGRANNSSNGQLQQQNGSNNRQGSNSNSTSGNNNLNNNMRRNQQQNQGQKSIPSNMNNVVDISDDSPTERQPSSTGNKIQIMTGNNSNSHHQQQFNSNNTSNLSSDPYDVPNLSLRQVCLCGKSCQMMQPKKDLVFKCCHCHLYYHI